MADVSVQMGVSGVGQFKSAMNEASASVKMLDTALKMNEQQLKSTGDKETYLQNKMVTLKAQIEAQTKVVKNAEAAWKTLLQNGADPMSKAAVEMQSKYYQANTALMQMTDSMKALESGETQAAEKADKLSSSLGGLNRTVSLEAVINGVGRVTTALENAGKRAVELGKALFDEIMDKAAWADDSATMAMMYGVDLDTFLKVQKLVQNGMDTSVDAILGSQQKLRKGIGSGADEIKNILLEFGLATAGGKDGIISIVDRDSVDLFWEAGQALMSMTDEFKQEDYAQKLFGKSWRELRPLFKDFANQDEFRAGLETVNANTEEEVNKLVELNDAVGKLQGNFDTLESKVMAGLAPALTKAADALSGLLGNILEYLDTPEGQQALADMEKAVSGLFEDLTNIEPEDVVEGFKGVFDEIVKSLQWLTEHSGDVITALKTIVYGWGGLQLFGGALQILQLINGLKSLKNGTFLPTGTPAAQTTSGGSGGGWLDWLTNGINGTAGKIASWAGSFGLQNLGFVYDWFMHNTAPGQTLTNGGSFQDAINAAVQGITGWWGDTKTRAGTFWEDWGGVFRQFLGLLDSGADQDYLDFEDELRKRIQQDLEAMPQGWDTIFGEPDITVKPVPGEDSAEEISAAVGVVQIPAELIPFGGRWINPSFTGGAGGGGGGKFGDLEFHANGLPYVPFDGYGAILHKGEQVVPARAISNTRNYNSNLYVENMVMNNGQDAEGLAAKVAAAQRWTNRGYGG